MRRNSTMCDCTIFVTSAPTSASNGGLPRFALDLRGVSGHPDADWLAASHDFRSIGAMAVDGAFSPVSLRMRSMR